MRIKNWAMPLLFSCVLLFAGIIATMFIGVVDKDDPMYYLSSSKID